MSSTRALMALCLLATLAGRTPAAAQAASCSPPLKWAAGACVAVCPGGFEDRGRECVYRSGR
ncbi:hypothetical protein [Salinarimonas soli]|uniref:Uncharacterized protein n=1 Tax=Salinarimonas soli TaxID=1638099 RepID=A0A5B2VGC5_9HYPH|nr:hypothetical protein [Salinarimonas soli]KAA2238141.1 hypothetical protein F0L46_06615 [Salinarimonas soli]